MTEAEKYTTEMWQRHLREVAKIVGLGHSKRGAYRVGYMGSERRNLHPSTYDAHQLGRQTAVLLGYIEADAEGGA